MSGGESEPSSNQYNYYKVSLNPHASQVDWTNNHIYLLRQLRNATTGEDASSTTVNNIDTWIENIDNSFIPIEILKGDAFLTKYTDTVDDMKNLIESDHYYFRLGSDDVDNNGSQYHYFIIFYKGILESSNVNTSNLLSLVDNNSKPQISEVKLIGTE